MAKIEMKGLNAYTAVLSNLERSVKTEVIGKAIYDAAGMVTDEIQKGISSIPTDNTYGWKNHLANGITSKQKAGLHNGLGISHMRDDFGYLNVRVGFDGYNDVKTTAFPNGQPNLLIARAVERGTSYVKATPFMKRSIERVRKKAMESMRITVDTNIAKIMAEQSGEHVIMTRDEMKNPSKYV